MKNLIFMVILLALIGCTNINFDEYLEKDKPFYLTQYASLATSFGTKNYTMVPENYTIVPNTEKHKIFLHWLNQNQGGWQSSPVSYTLLDFISQADTLTNFRILLGKERGGATRRVVLQFKDKKGEVHQYSKSTSGEELNFLYK